MTDFKIIFVIFLKDFRQELRSRAVGVASLFFSGVVLFVLAMAIGQNDAVLQLSAPGVLWVTLAFAGIISSDLIYRLLNGRAHFGHL